MTARSRRRVRAVRATRVMIKTWTPDTRRVRGVHGAARVGARDVAKGTSRRRDVATGRRDVETSGRPRVMGEEMVVARVDDARVRVDGERVDARARCACTTRRLRVERDDGTSNAIEISLERVREVERERVGMFGWGVGGGGVRVRWVDDSGGTRMMRVAARGASGKAFLDGVERAVERRRREVSGGGSMLSETDARRRVMGASASTAGVGGVVNRQIERAEETRRTMREAFADLQSLMKKAGEMVVLAERLAEATGGKVGEISDLQRLVHGLGIKSPVMRAATGADFHKELGKQLAEWIRPILNSSNGIITLTDAFCLFNRARGVELISPQDMLRACESWESLGVDVHLRAFDNGVMVIHTTKRSDEEVCTRFKDALPSRTSSLDACEAAKILETTPDIALEYLHMAEGRGLLCRDDGPAQMRFYANLFAEARLD